MTGIEMIVAERREQIHKHGFTQELDKKWTQGELLLMAHYLMTVSGDAERDNIKEYIMSSTGIGPKWFNKFDAKSDVARLAAAGALIAAEIDRQINENNG